MTIRIISSWDPTTKLWTAPARPPSSGTAAEQALEVYRRVLEVDCGGVLTDEHRNDKDAAAMLIADLVAAYPAVEREWMRWSP